MVTTFLSVEFPNYFYIKVHGICTTADAEFSTSVAAEYIKLKNQKITIVSEFASDFIMTDKKFIWIVSNFADLYQDKISLSIIAGVSGIIKIFMTMYNAISNKPYKRMIFKTYDEMATTLSINFKNDFKIYQFFESKKPQK
jgi:hypothetical protein